MSSDWFQPGMIVSTNATGWQPVVRIALLTLPIRVSMIDAMPTNLTETGNGPAERVFLIDSMSHIFRAFYAPMANRAAPLSNSKGQVTQAVFIFTNMLRKLLLDEKPAYIAAIFESKEKRIQ